VKYFVQARVFAVNCKLHFDSHGHSQVPDWLL